MGCQPWTHLEAEKHPKRVTTRGYRANGNQQADRDRKAWASDRRQKGRFPAITQDPKPRIDKTREKPAPVDKTDHPLGR